ncbi:MAG: RdgB/HAM1 family non-canonical purine NTP pyrophosphatase [Defluviicoccus sp.]|nr:RdgB/HAM1 family non-canonical purine NTP pyrophosphatase [Defluviicoccus sp.]MDE0382553.1 RdgB/HAM1 family non-canonical purine NTP pyrophosphatase [Defluviicoccus sp.]
MARRFRGARIVVASHNAGKVAEIADLLSPYGLETGSAGALGLAEPEETGATFRENAKIKALACACAAGEVALSDDSGLAVAALGGAPGIHSARWGGPGRDFALAMRRVEEALAPDADRRAAFVCALALAWPDRHVETFEGRVEGRLVWPPRGKRGFGYDPIFVPRGGSLTFGEMEPAAKHAISHRAAAFRKLAAACFADESQPAG